MIIPLWSKIGVNLEPIWRLDWSLEQDFYLRDDEGPLGMYSIVILTEEA